MLTGRSDILPEYGSSKDLLLYDPVSELAEDDESDSPRQLLYTASFKEFAAKYVQYETVIWVSISLLLVLAWGVGILMLLYLPMKRYVLQKDISSRRLYVTPKEIVYKVSRPSFIPFWGMVTIEKHVPLSQVIDIIVEQGWLQSVYGIHTFRVQSIVRGKAALVDELQVQGVSNPGLLRKVIVTEASNAILNAGTSWRHGAQMGEGDSMVRIGSSAEYPVTRSGSENRKNIGSRLYASVEPSGTVPSDLLLHRLEEVNKSVKKIESLIEKSQAARDTMKNSSP